MSFDNDSKEITKMYALGQSEMMNDEAQLKWDLKNDQWFFFQIHSKCPEMHNCQNTIKTQHLLMMLFL